MDRKWLYGGKCERCGKVINRHYRFCYECWQKRRNEAYQAPADVTSPGIEEISEDEYCVMCGREWGTQLRSDGKFYCSMCWAVWNS